MPSGSLPSGRLKVVPAGIAKFRFRGLFVRFNRSHARLWDCIRSAGRIFEDVKVFIADQLRFAHACELHAVVKRNVVTAFAAGQQQCGENDSDEFFHAREQVTSLSEHLRPLAPASTISRRRAKPSPTFARSKPTSSGLVTGPIVSVT